MCIAATEVMLSASALFFFVWSLRKNDDSSAVTRLAPWWGLAVVASAVMALPGEGLALWGGVRLDAFTQLIKLLLAIGFAVICFMSRRMEDVEGRIKSEWFMFLATATLGMTLLIGATDWITFYVAMELASYCLYVLVPLRAGRGDAAMEAGIKYFVQGVAVTGIMVYGFSLLFGVTGSLALPGEPGALAVHADSPVFWVGLLLVLVAVAFKLSLVPFHFWAPDVYQGANLQVVGYLATVSKVAALAVLLRFLSLVGVLERELLLIGAGCAALSMTLGNLAALVQRDVKRMIAYSGVAHAGYVLVACLCGSGQGATAALFYMAVYVIMTLAVFWVMAALVPEGRNVELGDFRGLYRRSPLLALTLVVGLFSLAGVPPLAGFTGKWFIFSTAVREGLVWLAVLGILNSVISLYYYLLIVREAYRAGDEGETIRVGIVSGLICVGFVLFLFWAGLLPATLIGWVEAVW